MESVCFHGARVHGAQCSVVVEERDGMTSQQRKQGRSAPQAGAATMRVGRLQNRRGPHQRNVEPASADLQHPPRGVFPCADDTTICDGHRVTRPCRSRSPPARPLRARRRSPIGASREQRTLAQTAARDHSTKRLKKTSERSVWASPARPRDTQMTGH